MGPNMSDAGEWDRRMRDARPLTAERWDALKQTAIRRAELARKQAVRAALTRLMALPRWAWRHLRRPTRRVPTASATTLASANLTIAPS